MTLGEMIKLGDLPLEEKQKIADGVIYNAEHEGEFFKEVNHNKLDANRTSMTFIRSYLPKIDKTSDRYKNGLVEGITPDPEDINEAEFTVAVNETGWYYKFTNKAVNHAYNDIRNRCSRFLQNLFLTYHDEKIADAYLSSANIVTGIDLCSLSDLLTLNTILFKNGAIPFEGGFYKLKVPAEVGDKMLVKFKDIITHTTQKEAIIKGEIGEIAGFRVIKSRLQAFKVDNTTHSAPFLAYGMTTKGEFPVSIVAYDNMASQIIVKPLGQLGEDPLNQRGSIGLYLDGHGFYMFDDSVCVTGTYVDADAGIVQIDEFDNSKRSNLKATGFAPSGIYPNVSFVEIAVEGYHVLALTDKDGTSLDLSDFTITSMDSKIAKMDADTAAVACVASKTSDVALNPAKSYYTRASSAAGAGKLNDGSYAYTLVTAPDVTDIGDYYEVSVIGEDAHSAVAGKIIGVKRGFTQVVIVKTADPKCVNVVTVKVL